MASCAVFEGTWEEVASQSERFTGKHVCLVIVGNGDGGDALPAFHTTATPEERARAGRVVQPAPVANPAPLRRGDPP